MYLSKIDSVKCRMRIGYIDPILKNKRGFLLRESPINTYPTRIMDVKKELPTWILKECRIQQNLSIGKWQQVVGQ